MKAGLKGKACLLTMVDLRQSPILFLTVNHVKILYWSPRTKIWSWKYLVDLHGLDLACMSDMWTSAQVDQGSTSIKEL